MTRWIGVLICAFAALALASCGGGGSNNGGGTGSYVLATSPHATAGAGSGTTMVAADEAKAADAVNWINAHRIANGFAALPWHAGIGQTAFDHSLDMFTRGFFDHINPDGDSPGDRITADGIPWVGWGENIAMGQPTGQAVAEAWMNSDGHRANILNGSWTALAVGAYTNGGTVWWTNLFIRQ